MSEKGLSQTVVTIIAVVVTAIVVGGVAVVLTMPRGPTTEYVSLQLDWLPGGAVMHLYVAKDMFWPQKGLDVNIVRGSGSYDTALKVGERIVEFGRSAFDAGVKAKTTALLPIVAIESLSKKSDAGYIWIKDRDAGRGIIDKDDLTTLQGKILAEPEWSLMYLQTPAFLKAVGLPPDAIIRQSMDPGATIPAVIRGDADLHGVGLGEEFTYNAAFAEEGLEGEWLWFKDYGFNLVGDTEWTNEYMIKERPETVRKFVEGIQEAFVWTVKNLEEASAIFTKYVPGFRGMEDVEIDHFVGRYKNAMRPEVDAQYGIGYMPPELVEATVNSAYTIHEVEPDFQLINWQDVYTNEFLNTNIKLQLNEYPWEWPAG